MKIIERITKYVGSSSGTLFRNGTIGAITNNTLSVLGVIGTSVAATKCAAKAVCAPTFTAKVLYGLSCASYSASLVGSSVCIATRSNPLLSTATWSGGVVGFAGHAIGRGLSKWGDYSSLGTNTFVDSCKDSAFDSFTG